MLDAQGRPRHRAARRVLVCERLLRGRRIPRTRCRRRHRRAHRRPRRTR